MEARMKIQKSATSWLVLVLLILVIVSQTGCKQEAGRTSLCLTMQNTLDQTRSLVPSDTPLAVSRYVITGAGPQGNTFEMQTTSANLEIEGLLIGNWEVTAVGQNSSGIDLVEGKTSCNLTSEPSNAIIELNSLTGNGTMTVQFTWDPSKISNPSIELWVTNQAGEKSAVIPTADNTINGSVTYSATYAAGSYTIQAKLYSGNIAVAGCAEAVRVVGNRTTEGCVALDLDKYAEIPSSLTLINKAGTPIECSISGISSTMEAFATAQAVITTNTSSDAELLEVVWFLDGEQLGSGLSCTLTPTSGAHRLDVIAKGALLASSGSASFSFQATVGGTAGVPVLVTEVADNTNGLYVSGNTKIAFLPDGKVLLASDLHKTLQICRIVRDTLEVIRTYTSDQGFNTVGITDLLVDKNTYRVAIADSYYPGIGLYQYDPDDASLTKLFYRDNVYYTSNKGEKSTFTETGMLSLDQSDGTLYCTLPGLSDISKNNFYAATENAFPLNDYVWWMWENYTEITGMVIAPGSNKAALFSEPDQLLKLCIRDGNSNLVANDQDFSSSYNGTPYLGGLRSVGFINDNNVVTGGDSTLCRFQNTTPYGWEQSDVWISGQDGVASMLGIEQLVTNPSSTLLYAICKDSRNINVFTIDSINSRLSFLEATSLGSFIPTGAEISPDKENLLVVSDTSNAILICRIPH